MAQRKQVTWGELKVGLFVILGTVLVMAGIFYVTGTTFLGGRYTLVTYLPEVAGLTVGAPVTLDGVEMGNVESIGIAPRAPGEAPDPERSVRVVMRVSRDYQDYIRSDSTAQLITEGFLGNRIVTVRRGYTGRVLQDGEEVQGMEEQAIRQIMERGAELMANLNVLSGHVASVVERIEGGQGTLGKLLTDEALYNSLNDTVVRANRLVAGVQEGQGTIGKLVTSDELYTRVNSSAARVDDMLAAVQEQRGSLGKFLYDPAMHDNATQFLANSNALMGDIRAGRGTLGKLATDETLFANWSQTGANLREATAKLNGNGSTMGRLFSDPLLYDNLTGLMGDMRLLVGEFRRDPSRFLRVRFSIF